MSIRVGFIGLGTMGYGMARNLAKAGFPLALSSRTISKAHALREEVRTWNPDVRVFDGFDEVGRTSEILVSCNKGFDRAKAAVEDKLKELEEVAQGAPAD